MNNCIPELYSGFELLDQTQRKNSHIPEKDVYNPSKEVVLKHLNNLINNSSDICGFTLTLKKKYHNDDDKWMHRQIHNGIRMSRVWYDKKYILFPEYTKKGVLHYHGVMWDEYQTEVMRCIKWWRRKYGFAKPELKINNKNNWIKYITKDYGNTGLWTISNLGK